MNITGVHCNYTSILTLNDYILNDEKVSLLRWGLITLVLEIPTPGPSS